MVSYTFTPSETGRYTIYGEAESKLVSFYVEDVTFGKYWDELRDDTQYSGQTMELTAGTEYTIVFVNYCDETVTVVYTLAKTTDASGISINGDKTIRTNNVAWIGLTYDNFLAFNEDIVWTSSNPEVADIVDDYSLSGCAVKGLKDGTAVITATVGSLSASCTVTVKTPVELQLDQQAEITTEAGVYTFTAEESGLYYFSWPMTVGINFWIGGSGYPADMGDRSGHVIELDAGAACELECSTTEGTSNLVVTKVTEATGIDFPDGDTISCEPGWIVAFPITLTGGDVADLQITSGDNSIAEPETYNTSVINVYFKSPGETTFTITSSGGINETFTVKCQDRASAAEKVWSGTQEGGTTLHMEYTPDEDGCYFLNWNNLDGEGVHVGEDSTQPLKSFDYDELVYCGMVYELEAGKTYCFESYNDYDREYTFYLTKVEEAKSFTVDSTLSGKVGGEDWLNINFKGALSTELTTSNPEVVLLGGGNASGNTVFFVGEGIAVITVTDHNGNKQTCDVTVSGTANMETFYGWVETGLASGKSKTYRYVPEETGMYWFFSELGAEWGIELTDVNGNAVTEKYEYTEDERCGKVYELTAGTEYRMTLTNPGEAKSTFVNATMVKEAEQIQLEVADVWGGAGRDFEIRYNLIGDDSCVNTAVVSAVSSNTNVVKVLDCNGTRARIELVGGGEAVVTLCLPNGSTAACHVHVEGEIILDAPKVSAANVGSTGKIKLTWNAVEGAAKYEVYRSTSKNGTYTKMQTITGTSYTNTSAKAGTAYYYKVRAVAEDGSTSEFSEVASRTCDCAQPVITLSNVASSGKIKVSWAKVDGAAKYGVYRSTSKNGTYSLLKTVTGTSYTDTTAKAGKTYYYKVQAIGSKSAANSVSSAVKSRTCDLARPTITLSNVASSGKIKVSWAKVSGAAKYKVYRSTSKSGTYTLLKTVTGTSYTDTTAKAGKTYYYKVVAVHASNTEAKSAYSTVKSRVCDLARPVVTVKLNSSNKPKVSWKTVSGAVKYKVYRSTSKSGTYSLLKTVTGTSYTDTTAKANKGYYYKVVAVYSKSDANSAYSTAKYIKTAK